MSMTTDISKLKGGKGTPPSVDQAPDVIADDPRNGPEATRPLQFRIPARVFHEFSERAAQEGGFTHGAKKQLFLKMWLAYKSE